MVKIIKPAIAVFVGALLLGISVYSVVSIMIAVGTTVGECVNEGWRNFNHPRSFTSQGDCEQYVITGK